MKCTLISLGLTTDAVGIRILSVLLREQGHRTQLVFLPSFDDLKRRISGGKIRYGKHVIDQLTVLARDSDVVGMSVMTHHFATATALTQELRAGVKTPIIWGGIHPTVCPDKCLEVADLVCVGEGETSLLKLARRIDEKTDFSGIQGIWFKQDGQVVSNGPGPLVEDLNSLPLLDYSFEDHHLLIDDRIQPMTVDNWKQHALRYFPPLNPTGKPGYQVLSARGCPYRCSFCGEVPLEKADMYNNRYFRKRSIDNLMQELSWVVATFPFMGEICFCDDTFPSRSLREIEDFSRKYKEKIKLPFYVLVSPGNVKKEKFDLLVDAGLRNLGMGIQSGSNRILKLYNRGKTNDRESIMKAARIVNSYKCLLPYYDFIVENPYETREDVLATLDLMIKLPKPMRTRVYALSFFPGTVLYGKAVVDGIASADMHDKTFGQRSQGGYLYFLIDLTKHGVPRPFLRLLVSKPFLFVFNRRGLDRLFLKFQTFVKGLLFRFHVTDQGLS